MSETLTAAQQSERLQDLRALVAEVLEIEPDELTDTSSFVDDHGADSLMAIEILARIERDLGVQIPQDALAEMTNLRSVYHVVATHAGWAVHDG